MRSVMILAALPFLAVGCCLEPVRYPRFSNPSNPFPVRKVAVCPLLVPSGSAPDPFEGAEALASELTGFPGFEVLWPRSWAASLRDPSDLEEVLNLARGAQADAVLLVTVNEHSPYPPPRIALAMALVPTRPLAQPAIPYEERMDAGRPLLEGLPKPEGGWLAAVGALEDARDSGVQDRLHAWGLRRAQSEATFDWKRGLYSGDEFLRFCLNESVRKLCDEGRRKFSAQKDLKRGQEDLYSRGASKPFQGIR